MKEFYINHGQDLITAMSEFKMLPLPFWLIGKPTTPTKDNKDEYEKFRKQMAYFHRTIVPDYAREAGVNEVEAKAELQIKFARVGEILVDGGEYDVLWLEQNRLRVFEEGKYYYVLSIAGMNNKQLADFIEQCKHYLLTQYGVMVKEYNRDYKTKKIKR